MARKFVARSLILVGALFINTCPFFAFATNVYAQPPTVSLAPMEGRIDDSVTVNGAGFPTDTGITVQFEGKFVTTGSTNSSGQFRLSITVPSGHEPGTKTITVTTGYTSKSTPFTLLPGIVDIRPQEARVGTIVALDGRGLNHNAVVSVYYDGVVVATAITASGSSAFKTSFTVPESPAGNHKVTARDSLRGYSDGQLRVTPSLKVDGPYQGAYGNGILVSGAGFSAQSSIKIALEGTTAGDIGWEWSPQTNSIGSFLPGHIKIGSVVGGPKRVKATDGNGYTVLSDETVTVLPSLTLIGPTSGTVGTSISLQGRGFLSGESGIEIFLGSSKVSPTQSNAAGSFLYEGQVPEISKGTWEVKASDSKGNLIRTSYDFTVEPAVRLDPGYGQKGTRVKFYGTGFRTGANIKMIWDGSPISPEAPAVSNDKGSVTGEFIVQAGFRGYHTLVLNDGKYEAGITWTMDGFPPSPKPTPTPKPNGLGKLISSPWFVAIMACVVTASIVLPVIYVRRRKAKRGTQAPEGAIDKAAIRALKKAEKKKQMEHMQQLQKQILELAQQNRGGVRIESITTSLNIDLDTAKQCLKKLKAHQENEWYYIPEIEKQDRKKN